MFNLGKEQNDLMAHVRHVTMTDDQLSYIEAFCAKIRVGPDNADFKTRRQIIELLDIRGQIAFEEGEKVIYLRCLIDYPEPQPVSLAPTSHSSNTGATAIMPCASPQMAPSR